MDEFLSIGFRGKRWVLNCICFEAQGPTDYIQYLEFKYLLLTVNRTKQAQLVMSENLPVGQLRRKICDALEIRLSQAGNLVATKDPPRADWASLASCNKIVSAMNSPFNIRQEFSLSKTLRDSGLFDGCNLCIQETL